MEKSRPGSRTSSRGRTVGRGSASGIVRRVANRMATRYRSPYSVGKSMTGAELQEAMIRANIESTIINKGDLNKVAPLAAVAAAVPAATAAAETAASTVAATEAASAATSAAGAATEAGATSAEAATSVPKPKFSDVASMVPDNQQGVADGGFSTMPKAKSEEDKADLRPKTLIKEDCSAMKAMEVHDNMVRENIQRSITNGEPFGKPFASQAQRAWMHIHHPAMAEKWEDHTPEGKKLPYKVKKKD